MPRLTGLRSTLRRAAAVAAPAALVLSAFAAGHVAAITDAEKYGTVTIVDADAGVEVVKGGEPHVCTFWFEFDLGIQADVVGWKVKEWNAAPLDGLTVLKGQGGPTDADGKLRVPDSGSLSVPNGRYNVVWDDEYPPDGSNGARSFVVDCQAAQPTPTPTPTPTPATPTPTGSDEGIGGTAGGGGGITAPPTDTAPAVAARDNDLGTLAAAATLILAVVIGALALIPRRAIRRAARNR
jgi:hypothetical protein